MEQIVRGGEVRTDTPDDRHAAEETVLRAMKMIGSTREYQFG